MERTRKCYGRTDGRTDGQTKAISIIPDPLRGVHGTLEQKTRNKKDPNQTAVCSG